tara:strand:+ start:6991 stop:7485 length:495 start_codon:yes stop_codon:yes gene_type:complete
MARTGSFGETIQMSLDQDELKKLVRSLDRVRDGLSRESKVEQIAFDAMKPLMQYAKQTAPVNKNKDYIQPKRHWKDYKPGALKRSIARWRYKGGALVGARFAPRSKNIASDGWYVHFAHDTHPVRGGKQTTESTPFMDHAIQAMTGITHKLLIENTKRMLDGLW